MKWIHLTLSYLLFFFIAGCIHTNEDSKTMNQQADQKSNDRGGIIFFASKDPVKVANFYIETIGCELWLDQGACKILKHGNRLFGFCESDHADQEAVITFFYPTKEKVDHMYKEMKDRALEPPKMNPKFHIYHFYARDPENRSIEFQFFDHELKPY